MTRSSNVKEKELNNIQELFKTKMKVVGQEHCEIHNETYERYETPAGVAGSCSKCFRERMEKEDEKIIQKALENRQSWQLPFVEQHERVTSDLKTAKVNNYKPGHETQLKAKQLVIDYIKNFDNERSLVLSGRAGAGKSHLAYSITKELREKGYKTWFIKTRDLLDLIKNTYSPGAQLTEERIFKVIESIDLLVLDDVGSEYVKTSDTGNETWASDILYAVFDARLNKSVVSTTNYTENELESKYGYNGERIVSRMMENAGAVRLQGEDHRRKNRF